MLSRMTKIQLTLFVVVTAVALTLMALNYVQLPAQFGFGRYVVTVQITEAGGLYPKSVVTYRGHEVGQVTSVDLREGGGVVATVQVDNDVQIPRDTTVEVRSASVIGEQYLNFVPTNGGGPFLGDGAVVPADQVTIPTSTGELIESTKSFLESVPVAELQTTVNELGLAFGNNGDNLGRLIDSGAQLQQQATDNLQVTLDLIDQLGPVLRTQQQVSGDVRDWSSALAGLTEQVATSDDDIRSLLQTTQPLAAEAGSFMSGLQPVLPSLLTDVAATGQVVQVYLPAVHHLLSVVPAAEEMLNASMPRERWDDPYPLLNLSFKLGVNDPPVCTEGFVDNGHERSPKELDYENAPAPPDSYCKIPQDDPRIVRGARNQVCPDDPNRYGAKAADCGLVFQQDSVDRNILLAQAREKELHGGGDRVTMDSATGRLLAPDGAFFLFDFGAEPAPDPSLAGFMTGLLR